MENVAERSDEQTFVQVFEETIPEDAMVVKCKFNDIADDEFYPNVKSYIQDELKAHILYSSAGIHKNGSNAVPHIHYHFITTKFKVPSNPSQHRKRWVAKDIDTNYLGENCSIQFGKIEIKKPKYHVLAYPLKEGLVNEEILALGFHDYTQKNGKMKKNMKTFLMDVGKEIYEKAMAAHDRREKSDERKQIKLTDLYDLCRENRESFTTYLGMKLWLDSNYIDNLELSELPDSRNYKNNCEKVAVKLRILKYSDII